MPLSKHPPKVSKFYFWYLAYAAVTKGGLKSESAGGFSIAQPISQKAILNYYILYAAMIKFW